MHQALLIGVNSAARFGGRDAVLLVLRADAAIEQSSVFIDQTAHGFDVGLHGHQHAAYVGVVNDRRHLGGTQCAALMSFLGVLDSLLVGAVCDRQTFVPDAQPGPVHHGEHGAHAVVFAADEIADGTLGVLSVVEHGGRARVDTHLVFERGAVNIVTLAEGSVFVDEKLGDDEEGDPFGAGW